MKLSLSTFTNLLAVLLTGAVLTLVPVSANEDHDKAADTGANGKLARVDAQTDVAWLAKARADYPMDTCSVSGDKFDGGDMGKPQEYVYKQEGKPDRLVRFCCKDCVGDFKKDPAKYLKTIDDAAAAKTSGAKK